MPNSDLPSSAGVAAEVPAGCPVDTSQLAETEVTYDEGNNGVIYVNARNNSARPVIMHLLARTSERDRPDEVRCWPPITVGPHGVVLVYTDFDPAGGTCYGTSFRLWHSRFASEDELSS